MTFDPKRYLISLKGKDYLPVAARLIWFRQEHPDWSIITTPVEINLEKQYAIFSASIMNADGKIIATGTKMETVKDFGDYLEKSETGSVGRALAMCGYGTQFAPELAEGGRLADSPQGGRFAPRPGGGNFNRAAPPVRPNGNGNGNGMNEVRPPMPMTAPDEPAFDAPRTERPVERPAPVAQRPPQDAPRPAPVQNAEAAPNRVQRVREPEPDYSDPGGSDEPDSPDDPFGEDVSAMPAPSLRDSEPQSLPPVQLGSDKPNPLAGNPTCSSPGCTMKLTPGQVTLSVNKFGKPLCVIHQKEAVPVGAGASANGF
ncbi:MAG: hypothetical protein H7Y38_20885 [Armatimonadetes bacterium]|nr:hypothetical protein [Armatimonadota bacterium]